MNDRSQRLSPPAVGHAPDLADVARLKGMLPFRLGATSFVFPADVLPNVEALARHVDDVEILCFESDAISPLPSPAVIRRLQDLAQAHDLTYTVHLPLDADIGSLDTDQRADSVRKIIRVFDRMATVRPFAWILHIPAPAGGMDHESAHAAEWRDTVARSLAELAATDVGVETICVETLDYPYAWVVDPVLAGGFSVCLDVGHLWLHELPLETVLHKVADRIRVVHLHGVRDGKDHRSLTAVEAQAGEILWPELWRTDAPQRVVTLEVFNTQALLESMKTISELQ